MYREAEERMAQEREAAQKRRAEQQEKKQHEKEIKELTKQIEKQATAEIVKMVSDIMRK